MGYFAILFCLLIFVSSAFAEVLTIEDAERMFIENNLELKAKKAELKRYDAEVINASLLSNPSFKYNLDSVKNGDTETEETYSISQSIDVVNKRRLRISSAEKRRDAQYLFYEHEIKSSVAHLKQLYFRILLLMENERLLTDIHDMFLDVEKKTTARLNAGDVAEVELMRLSSEKDRIMRIREGIKSEIRTETRRLEMLLNKDGIAIKDEFYRSSVKLNMDEILRLALEKRSDIKAGSLLSDASDVDVSLSKKEAIMPVDIEAGYKKRTGGFNGFVFGISVPLPIFNRNQGTIASAMAEQEAIKINMEAAKRRLINEINSLFENIIFLDSQAAKISGQLKAAKDIAQIVGIAYEEGEASLLEMLDAERAKRELAMEYNQAVYEYWAAIFELEKAAGIRIVEKGGVK
jgi:cobalt-zinc-cadmium efflux system outer membrane protein